MIFQSSTLAALFILPVVSGFTAPNWVVNQQSTKLDAGKTLYDKIFEDHTVTESDGSTLLYIDRHLVHEVTSPQAFEGLRLANRGVRRPDCTLLTVDHNVPTEDRTQLVDVESFISEINSKTQVLQLEKNVEDFGLKYFGMEDERQGIVHIIGPEQGFTLPGTTCVCGDSHTATHGAFGSLAFGIGTSEVEHVLATSTLPQVKGKNFLIKIDGDLNEAVTSKDIILHICGIIGTAGGTGCVIEFAGSAVRSLSMEARMSVSNMAIEAGARAGLIAPDEVTFEYLKGRPMSPSDEDWDNACAYWKSICSDDDAVYDKVVEIDATDIAPTVTWGTSPQDVVPITGNVPDPNEAPDATRKAAMERSLNYIGLEGNQPLEGVKIDKAFIGSCTNGRIEDLREVAAVAMGRKVADHVHALVVPGSGLVKKQAEDEGLDKILIEAGFDWREPGCSMCLAMNPDKLNPQERCASTSNRNFEGRQGNGGRTHLMSPGMAAAAAIEGRLVDVRCLSQLSQVSGNKIDLEYAETAAAQQVETPVFVFAPEEQAAEANESVSAGMPVLNTVKSIAAPLDLENIDTDMIIPARFLKTIKRTGLGVSAFFNMRYEADDSPKPDFVFNKPEYKNANILIAGDNFGCGSSREHAPWALMDLGITCIVSTSFADIFFGNCFKNGMLPVVLQPEQVRILMGAAQALEELEVDLVAQTITRIPTGETFEFSVDPFRKHCLLNGLDDIGITLQKKNILTQYEQQRGQVMPWLDNVLEAHRKAVPAKSCGGQGSCGGEGGCSDNKTELF